MDLAIGYLLFLAFVPQTENATFHPVYGGFEQSITEPAFVASMGLKFTLGRFTLSPTIETYTMKSKESPFFNPFRSDYEIRAEFRLSDKDAPTQVTAGAWHECVHPVDSGDLPSVVNRYAGGETRFYLKIQGLTGP